jgi:riboflavin biosynthesis pyrimidine reductase
MERVCGVIDWRARFDEFCERRLALASAPLAPVRSVAEDLAARDFRRVGDALSASTFDGPFLQSPVRADRPSLGVVFVTSVTGDTETDDPASLGGGVVDHQLIYEGLTRVAADAVVVGARTLHAESFFSVWRPDLVALRSALHLPRHPTQVVLSVKGSIDPNRVLLFNVPEVRVIVVTSAAGADIVSQAVRGRPWVQVVTGASLEAQFRDLKALGIDRACSVGGRHSATALVDAGLADDVYLTRTPDRTARPGTPWYAGRRPPVLWSVQLKEWDTDRGRVTFRHWVIAPSAASA